MIICSFPESSDQEDLSGMVQRARSWSSVTPLQHYSWCQIHLPGRATWAVLYQWHLTPGSRTGWTRKMVSSWGRLYFFSHLCLAGKVASQIQYYGQWMSPAISVNIGCYSHKLELCLCSVMSNILQPMDSSLPSSCVYGISQARILEWVAISSSRGSIFPAQVSNTYLLCLLYWQADSVAT